jgi:hypothetical protein
MFLGGHAHLVLRVRGLSVRRFAFHVMRVLKTPWRLRVEQPTRSQKIGAVEHRLGGADFGLMNGRRRLDVHDHRMLEIDEVVVRISITGDGVGRSGVAGGRIGRRDRLRLDRRRPAEGRVIENRQIFRDCATGRRIEVLDLGVLGS